MTPLRQRLIEDIRLRNFSEHTVEAYVRAVARFAAHHSCSPERSTQIVDAETLKGPEHRDQS